MTDNVRTYHNIYSYIIVVHRCTVYVGLAQASPNYKNAKIYSYLSGLPIDSHCNSTTQFGHMIYIIHHLYRYGVAQPLKTKKQTPKPCAPPNMTVFIHLDNVLHL